MRSKDAATLFVYFFSINIADEDENEFEKSIVYDTEYIYETYYETDGDISESPNSGYVGKKLKYVFSELENL